MKFYTVFPEFDKSKKTVVTLGTFDGVHKGHKDLLNTIKEVSEREQLESVLITFEPHPRTVVSADYKIKILTTLEEKKEVLENYGIDNLLVINFTEEFRNLNASEFIENILIKKLNPAHIVIGYDHKFGKDRKGDGDFLNEFGRKYNFRVTTVAAVEENQNAISSTKIRAALSEGRLKEANFYLDRNYSLTGKVITGSKRGRNLGFPTANIKPLNEDKLIPFEGVYAVLCRVLGKEFKGILNIGRRPTFEENSEPVIEAHLFDLNNSIYEEEIKIEFVERIRDEKKFPSKEELIKQINKDIIKTKEILNN